MIENYFCVRQKNRRKHNQYDKLLFFTINLHFITSNQISIYRKLNLPLTNSIYLAFLPLEMQRRLKLTKVYYMFFTFSEKKRPSCDSYKDFSLQCVCYWNNLLQWMIFIPYDSWKTLLFMKIYRFSEVFLSTMLMPSLRSVFWNKSVFYALSPQYQHDAKNKVLK